MKYFDTGRLKEARAAFVRLFDLKRLACASADAVALLRARPAFGGFALLGRMMITATVVQIQRAPVAVQQAVSVAGVANNGSKKKTKAPRAPSVFAKESAMSPHELLHRWDDKIAAAAKRFNVPEDWIRAVMIQESGGRTMLSESRKWISDKGAMGLMQLMPDTYRELRQAYGFGADPFDPDDNINAGAAYLKWLHAKYGMSGMFVAYNAGPLRFEQSIAEKSALPLETQLYVKGIARSLGFEENSLLPPSMRVATTEIAELETPAPLPVVKMEAELKPIAPVMVEEEVQAPKRDFFFSPMSSGYGTGTLGSLP